MLGIADIHLQRKESDVGGTMAMAVTYGTRTQVLHRMLAVRTSPRKTCRLLSFD